MKDYSVIEETEYGKHYYNENNQLYRLIGPAIEWLNGDRGYYINNILYMKFYKYDNELYIYQGISELTLEYEQYIKQNLKDLIIEYNIKIELGGKFYTQKDKLNKNYLKKLPDWLKDLIIL